MQTIVPIRSAMKLPIAIVRFPIVFVEMTVKPMAMLKTFNKKLNPIEAKAPIKIALHEIFISLMEVEGEAKRSIVETGD
jgi:hypothetical protein